VESVKKLSVIYCKKILESGGKKYSDEETEKSETYLMSLGAETHWFFLKIRSSKKASVKPPGERSSWVLKI
jgi:hypothetical protein